MSKLRDEAARYVAYDGPDAGRGKRQKSGKKLDYRHMDVQHLTACSGEKDIETTIYQMALWHKQFADLLQMVVIVKTKLKTHAVAHVV